MKFLVDESADARLVDHLIALGHEAAFIAHRYGSGLSDRQILRIAAIDLTHEGPIRDRLLARTA